jgi:hypothetical protein
VRPRCHDRPAEGRVRSSQALRARALAFPKIARSPCYVLLDEKSPFPSALSPRLYCTPCAEVRVRRVLPSSWQPSYATSAILPDSAVTGLTRDEFRTTIDAT